MLMMETDAGVSSMIMYEDESVDVRYLNGTQLQLSPCGGEFLLVKAADSSGHPLQPRDRVRQRTRFTISTYKAMIEAALAFRNKHASRPYLPEELIPPEHRKVPRTASLITVGASNHKDASNLLLQPFFTINLDVQWPDWSSCEAEQGPGGETIIRSEEGRAALILSPSGEEFSVEFTCSLSQSAQSFNRDPDGRDSPQQDDKLICQTTNKETREVHQPGGIYQSTTVVQHHSCFRHAPIWSYPLSLACHHRMARLSTPNVVRAEGMGDSAQADQKMNMSDAVSEERRSHLPQALPLTCPSLHRHRWKFKDPLAKNEQSDQDFPLELVKVMWCQGVTYRILSGAVSVVEVSPGDGSVIRSNGVLNTYFTHHQPDRQSGQVKELSYHLNNLPPDICRQDYSICSIVSRASRILTCYNQTKQSLKIPVTLSCLQEAKEVFPTDVATTADICSIYTVFILPKL
ncbi:uncharacterized protein C5orf34 homolog isoform X2 [Echeneis naucrates]|uniref:uncharacterized protein C5orf34 homolog isoform X2 n=1 Tax=Echeneis naucrates TaxID=173247 RepID=UPI0011138813|nr:uncharacterized protein C5orf34 homolog isoform X2 [Echeneis naucrates]